MNHLEFDSSEESNMEVNAFYYKKNKGWSHSFPPLDSPQTLILIFAAPEYFDDQEPFKALYSAYPNSKIIGCSSAGEIFGQNVMDESIAVTVVRFEHTPIKITETTVESAEDSYKAGTIIANNLNGEDLRGIFVLSKGLHINGSELTRGLNSLHTNLVITGGLAGDGNKFQRTWSLYNHHLATDTVVAVGFYGDFIRLGHGSQGGWDIFGPIRRITKSKGNILYELDNKPALSLYKEYLGERASGLPATGLLFPLAIKKDANDTKELVRTILGVDEKNQALIFAGDVPTGYLARLMKANFNRLVTGAQNAGQLAANVLSPKIEQNILLIAISCFGRRMVLGERIEEETESTLLSFPQNTIQIGFYSYGELSPYATGDCDFHNQTMTLTSIFEE